jgi:hypothetical protein
MVIIHRPAEALISHKDPFPEKSLEKIKKRLPQKGFMRRDNEIFMSQDGFLREHDRTLLISLLYNSSHQRATVRWMMALPDHLFSLVSVAIIKRLEKIPFYEEIPVYRRMGKLDVINKKAAIDFLTPVARANEPALFERVLNIGFPLKGATFDDFILLQAVEAIQDPGTAAIMARWIMAQPQRYMNACRINPHKIANNPKPAIALLTIPGFDISEMDMNIIHRTLAGRSPMANLFMPSNHQRLVRYAFSKQTSLAQVLGCKLRELKKLVPGIS